MVLRRVSCRRPDEATRRKRFKNAAFCNHGIMSVSLHSSIELVAPGLFGRGLFVPLFVVPPTEVDGIFGSCYLFCG
ncbi:unnamed protein product [Callosobruchus maculatus]|uniref:Uncharacterized protein n=1 Tax=Callosobruchus maculatus TaxID=64391 RepID=A0A653C903_CALMS|nr:unnamed protein product [Callosobruchus maculatus]